MGTHQAAWQDTALFIHPHLQLHHRNVVSEGSDTTPGPCSHHSLRNRGPLLQTDQQPSSEERQVALTPGCIPDSPETVVPDAFLTLSIKCFNFQEELHLYQKGEKHVKS